MRMNQIDLRLPAGWIVLMVGVSALVVLFAGWAPLVLLAMVGVAFLSLSLFHATATAFVALPFFFHETAPFTDELFAGVLLLLAVAWCSRLLLQPDRIRLPLSYVVLYLAFLSAIGLSCVF